MTAGFRHDDLRRRNRALVISAVRRSGTLSRTSVAALTGLSNSTISAISADLINEGILAEAATTVDAEAKRGRPQVAMAIDPHGAVVVAVVLSLNALSGALIDYAGGILAENRQRISTLTLERPALMAAVEDFVGKLIGKAHGRGKVRRIVLATQGTTDATGEMMLWSPITPHSDLPFARHLEARFGVAVTVQNDCNMMAEALRWRNPELYRTDGIAILLSQGIGMGLMSKGELFTGRRSSGAEFGHMNHRPDGALCRCGRHGCIEAYAGNYAIWRNAKGQPETAEPSDDVEADAMDTIAETARRSPGPEREAFAKAGEALGFGLGSLFALIDPAPVAFVGWGAKAFDLIEPALQQALAKTAGGQHSAGLSYETIPDELALIQSGCAMLALTYVDSEIFAAGMAGPGSEAA